MGVEEAVPHVLDYFLYLAVPSFFVISGYLITASTLKNDFKTFLKKRLGRIYPAYIFSIIFVIVLFAPLTVFLKNGGVFDLMYYITQSPTPLSFFIESIPFKAGSLTIGTTLVNLPPKVWNGSAWTLIFEFGCYFAIALILYSLNKFINKKEYFPKLIFGTYIFFLIIAFLSPRNGQLPLKGWNFINTAIYFFTVFLGGSFVYLIKDKIKFSYKLLFLAIIWCIIFMVFLPYHAAMEISAIPMIYIILFISVTFKSPKWIQRNDISYGIYIYAWPIQTLMFSFFVYFGIPKNIYLFIFLCMIVVVIFATFSWFLIEKPILNWINKV